MEKDLRKVSGSFGDLGFGYGSYSRGYVVRIRGGAGVFL
jgi:hypothetical protein